jgi:hypothetical protein
MELIQIENEALQLSEEERVTLANSLLQSLEHASEKSIADLWAAEAKRRAEQIDNGTAELIDSDDVEQEALALLK